MWVKDQSVEISPTVCCTVHVGGVWSQFSGQVHGIMRLLGAVPLRLVFSGISCDDMPALKT